MLKKTFFAVSCNRKTCALIAFLACHCRQYSIFVVMRHTVALLLLLLAVAPLQSQGGPIAYGICQAGCATVTVACYSAAGATFGTVLAVGAPSAIVACNTAFGTCSHACAITCLVTPIP